MQIQKDNIRKVILEVARKEFLEHGFKNTSMRVIAKKANVVLSNIYNYFKNKDEILQEVLHPLLSELYKILYSHNIEEHLNTNIFTSEEYQRKHINIYVEMILKFNNEFNLLLFKSHGSSLENFRDDYIDKHTKLGHEYLDKMKERYPQINANISEFFMHTMSSWWLNNIGEIVSHDLEHKEIEKFVSEYMEFATAGWKQIMRV